MHGTGTHWLHVWHHDPQQPAKFAVLRQNLDLNNGILTTVACGAQVEYGGSQPTVADFDGDGTPNVGVAGAVGYIVFSGKKLIQTERAPRRHRAVVQDRQDCSSAFTGSSVFNFDGNGKAEVVYADRAIHAHLRWHHQQDDAGVPNTSGTLRKSTRWSRDVDGDSQADIVVTSNSYSDLICPMEQMKTQGVRVFGDTKGQWCAPAGSGISTPIT